MTSEKKTIVTHSAGFHADDVFAVATLLLVFGEGNCEVVRTRDKEKIDSADIVLDVGMEYDPEKNRFDHHQPGGAGERENGIPYASFGLIWKHFGEQLCGSPEVAAYVDRGIVQSIDASDNGVTLIKEMAFDVPRPSIDQLMHMFYPTRHESESTLDERFMDLVFAAGKLIERFVIKGKEVVADSEKIQELYEVAEDKRLLVLDQRYAWRDVIYNYSEVLFVVVPRYHDDGLKRWSVYTVRKGKIGFEARQDLPAAWAGKEREELAAVTGVPDAIFCHRKRFMCAAESKEGTLALAQKALAEE